MHEAHHDPRDQEDRENTGQRRHEPPAEGIDAEDLHAGADEPLPQLGVDDVGGLRRQRMGDVARGEERIGALFPLGLVAHVPEGVALLDVVDLVEHEAPRVGQPDEAGDRRQHGDDHGDDPAVDPQGRGERPCGGAQPETGPQTVLGAVLHERGRCLWGRCGGRLLGRHGDSPVAGHPVRQFLLGRGVPPARSAHRGSRRVSASRRRRDCDLRGVGIVMPVISHRASLRGSAILGP